MPEIVLLHKATTDTITAQNKEDLLAVLGSMSPSQRAWLENAISGWAQNHPWLVYL